jgi:hypothetical protein
MTISPYNREARDAMAREIFTKVMIGAENLDSLTPGEQEGLYDKVADLSLAMANRFQTRAWVTPV